MEFSKYTNRGDTDSVLPSFMQKNVARTSLNLVNDKSLKDNNYEQSYFVSKPTTLRVLSNSQISKNRVSELSKAKKHRTETKHNDNSKIGIDCNSGLKSYNKPTFYKLLS